MHIVRPETEKGSNTKRVPTVSPERAEAGVEVIEKVAPQRI
jgi:hypothetical protein